MVQIYAFASLFETYTLERLALEFLDLTFGSWNAKQARESPSDALMTWAWTITPRGSVVRTYLLRVCFWHFMLRRSDPEHQRLGTQGWTSRLEGSRVTGFHDMIMPLIRDSTTARSLISTFDEGTQAPSALQEYLMEARRAVVPFASAEISRLTTEQHRKYIDCFGRRDC